MIDSDSPRDELPLGCEEDASPSKSAPSPNDLSKEEQMAAYEKALKESDWGHQPC